MRPTRFPATGTRRPPGLTGETVSSVNQRLPSGPAVIPAGSFRG